MKTKFTTNRKDKLAAAAILALMFFGIVGGVAANTWTRNVADVSAQVNKAAQAMPLQHMEPIVVTAQRMQIARMETILVTASRHIEDAPAFMVASAH